MRIIDSRVGDRAGAASAFTRGRMSMEPVVATVTELFHTVHGQLREEIAGLDGAALNWSPGPDMNSIAVLVVHTLGSEAEVLRTVHAVAGSRDRDAEFRSTADAVDDLASRLDTADAFLDQIAAEITQDDLAAVRSRGDRTPQTGLYWLLSNYGHAREHLAHIQLTKQVYAQRKSK